MFASCGEERNQMFRLVGNRICGVQTPYNVFANKGSAEFLGSSRYRSACPQLILKVRIQARGLVASVSVKFRLTALAAEKVNS